MRDNIRGEYSGKLVFFKKYQFLGDTNEEQGVSPGHVVEAGDDARIFGTNDRDKATASSKR